MPRHSARSASPARGAAGHEPLGQGQGQRKVGHHAVKRLVARMNGLEPAQAECHTRKSATPGRQLDASGVRVGCGHECHVVQPHRNPIRRGDIKHPVQNQVRRIKRGDVALCDERHAQPEPVAPERKPAHREAAHQLAFERPVKPVRIAPDGFIPEEQRPEQGSHQQHRQPKRCCALGRVGESLMPAQRLGVLLGHRTALGDPTRPTPPGVSRSRTRVELASPSASSVQQRVCKVASVPAAALV